MTGLVRIFVFFFNFHVSVRFMVLLALGLIFLGVLAGNAGPAGWLSAPRLLSFGSILLMMPVMWSAIAFRQLASNRRLTLVPRFRVTAIAAFFLVAVAVALVSSVSSGTLEADGPDVPPWLGSRIFAIAFAIISLFLLFAQWSCTRRQGLLLQFGLIVLLLNGFLLDPGFVMLLAIEGARPAGWLVAALLGWLWLLLALRRGVIASPAPNQGLERMTGGARSLPFASWQPNFGAAAGPEGSLMRGMPDSLSNRVWQAAIWVLFVGSLFLSFGLMTRNPMFGPRGPGITPMFVGVSLMSVAVLAPLTLAEWPARLRHVWLRGAGDRNALWSLLERALLEQTLIVAGIAAAAASLLMTVAAGDVELLLAYVAGCAIALPFGGYLGFWLRGRAVDGNVFGIVLMVIWIAAFWIVLFVYRNFGVAGTVPVMVGFAGLGLLWRQLARASIRSLDWCAVRPARVRDPLRMLGGRR